MARTRKRNSGRASGAIRGHRPATSNRASATSTAGLPTSSNITPVTTAALPTRSTLSGKPGPDRTGANRETHYEFRWYHFRPRHHRPVDRRLDVHHLDPRQARLPRREDRKSIVAGKSGSVRVAPGGRRIIKKKK